MRKKLALMTALACCALAGGSASQAAAAGPCSGTFGPTVNVSISCSFPIASFELTVNQIVTDVVPFIGFDCTKPTSITIRCTRQAGEPATTSAGVVFGYEDQSTNPRCSLIEINATVQGTGGETASFPLTSTCGGGSTPPPATGKPGCGPKRTNGLTPAGQHTGQPPKNNPPRSHCPPRR